MFAANLILIIIINSKMKANIIPILVKQSPTEKKWAAIREEYIQLWMEGRNDEYIVRLLSDKYWISETTIRVKVNRTEARREAARLLKQFKTTPKRETQLQPMNGVEYR